MTKRQIQFVKNCYFVRNLFLSTAFYILAPNILCRCLCLLLDFSLSTSGILINSLLNALLCVLSSKINQINPENYCLCHKCLCVTATPPLQLTCCLLKRCLRHWKPSGVRAGPPTLQPFKALFLLWTLRLID